MIAAEELLTSLPSPGSLGEVAEVSVIWDSDSDPAAAGDAAVPLRPYSEFKGRGSREPLPWAVDDELATISINYTSGTTGDPKGVSYTHRGAYLNSLGGVIHSGHSSSSVYLWTLPMLHCNDWCTAWGASLRASGDGDDRRRRAEPHVGRGDGGARSPGDHVYGLTGGLRAVLPVRLAAGLARARARRAGPKAGAATELAFAGGWFHSGDLGVMHPDGYGELMDRAKDIVISGGENMSTVEVERTLLSHPAVVDAAVIAVPDERWGERPKAFVVLGPGQTAGEHELIDHVRSRIAHYTVEL